ncbi:ABC transporter ATP-binding protein [Demetria terragena]|uniref:ABC transporter ATP-binding protein n=1 Tax=Demetria terragena TaxID=63959 RepID=UPI000360EB8A|nr:ABC transporter ATP-binding protein [Demetria terragena]
MTTPVLEARNLVVRAGQRSLVRGVDLTVGAGERVGLIGESGSGKSLTSLALLGLLPEGLTATGEVVVDGVEGNLLEASETTLASLRGHRMSMIFQEPMTALNPTMRVGNQVAEVMLIHGTRQGRKAARQAAIALLDDVGLPSPAEAAKAYPHQLSGGQRQRVVAAIALANDPDLLICDEPTTALDVTVQALVLDLITRGIAQRDAAMLFISHDLAVVATVCDQVLVMTDGKVVERGPTSEVLARPQHEYTQKLLAASDLSKGAS